MASDRAYQLAADAVLSLHALLVLFVIGGLALVLLGNARGWRWVNFLAFRMTHLAAIAIVVAQSWLGMDCPLTVLEMWLREKAHEPAYAESFIAHWLAQILYYQAPEWVFTAAYTLFGILIAACLAWFPPERRRRGKRSSSRF